MSAERLVSPEAIGGDKSEPKKLNPIKKWAQRIALGTAMVGGGYQVGHEQGRAEVLQPEGERIEEDAEALAEELDDIISLIDDTRASFINREGKVEKLRTKYRVALAHAVGMTADFSPDSSQKVAWQKSARADEIYKKIDEILAKEFFGSVDDRLAQSIRSAAQNIMLEKVKGR